MTGVDWGAVGVGLVGAALLLLFWWTVAAMRCEPDDEVANARRGKLWADG